MEPPSQSKKRRDGRKSCNKKTVSTSPTRSTDFGNYFEEIGLSVKEPMVEVPPPPQKKKKSFGLEKRVAYKYSKNPNFFADLAATHSGGEVQDLLTAGIDFLELG